MLNLRNTTFNTRSISVTWDSASGPYCGKIIYQVEISYNGEAVGKITATELGATFHNLMESTIYSITVVSMNRAGIGISEVRDVTTAGNDEVCAIKSLNTNNFCFSIKNIYRWVLYTKDYQSIVIQHLRKNFTLSSSGFHLIATAFIIKTLLTSDNYR